MINKPLTVGSAPEGHELEGIKPAESGGKSEEQQMLERVFNLGGLTGILNAVDLRKSGGDVHYTDVWQNQPWARRMSDRNNSAGRSVFECHWHFDASSHHVVQRFL